MPFFLFALLIFCCAPQAVWASESLFEVSGKPMDAAQHVLDFLFKGSSTIFNDAAGSKLHSAIKTLFTYYSSALLIFAILIVIYHIMVMVGETAHTGVPFGKRSKQMWTPIRLVLAVGLLIPVGGFSASQYLVMQMARMGSGLASNGWNAFAESVQPPKLTLHGTSHIDPTATIAHFVAIGLCVKSYEIAGSALPLEKLLPFVTGTSTFVLKNEESKSLTRTLYQAKPGNDPKILPITCGNLTWIEPEPLRNQTTMSRVASRFAKAHLEAIKEVQGESLNLGGSMALGSAGVLNPSETSYASRFTALVESYQKTFLKALRADKITIDKQGNITAISDDITAPLGGNGWLMAGTTLQKFALTDTVLLTPELAMPVVSFHYPLFAASNDKATLQLARGLSFAHLLLQSYDPQAATALWFNPTLDHGKGPIKQALTLTANVLARHEQNLGGQSLLDTGVDENNQENIGLFKPIALGFRALDLADEFWAVAEWSPRANSPIFGPALIFGNLARAVKAALLAANPRVEVAQLAPDNLLDIDQPADYARGLIALLGAVIFLPALLLVFVLPLLPLLHFALGGLVWLIAVFQGIVAAPIWALTFLSQRGDALIPPGSQLGIALILNIFLRPILMILGFITALLLMHVGFGLLEASLQLFTYDGLQGSKTLYSLGSLALLIVDLLLSYALANASMKCISLFPEFTLRWLGSAAGGATSGEAGQPAALGQASSSEASSAATAAAASGMAHSMSAMQSSQQIWQRKLLGVLEQIAGQNGSNSPTQNASLFAHLGDKPDQAPTTTTNNNTTTASATATLTSTSDSTVTTGTPQTSAGKYAQPNADPKALMAQTIRGTQEGEPTSPSPTEKTD